MRIAVWHNLPSGGGKRALYDQVKGLLRCGHTIESWCPPSADQAYLPLGELVPEHIVPLDWQPKQAATAIGRVWAKYHNHNVVSKLKAMDRHCRACAEKINRRGFDLFFANTCRFFRTTSIGRYVNIPAVIYLQEPCPQLYEALPRLPWVALLNGPWWTPRYLGRLLKDWIKVRWLRIQAREELTNAQAFDAILVNSLFSRESVLRAYGLDARVCYLGVDTELFADHRVTREDFVVGVGAFVATKNIEFVIQALAQVREPRPRLVWVGNVAFVRRMYWQGVSEALTQIYLERPSILRRMVMALARLWRLLWSPSRLIGMFMPTRNAKFFMRKCEAWVQVGRIVGIAGLVG